MFHLARSPAPTSLEPTLSRAAALELAAEQNRQRRADNAAWDGQWTLVLEVGEVLPLTWTLPEFAGDIGLETLVTHRALRLVRPTAAEIAQFTGLPTVA
jgi:hypothetical protein